MAIETSSKEPINAIERLRAHRNADDVAKSKRVQHVLNAYLPLPRDEELQDRLNDLIEHCAMALEQVSEGRARGRLLEGRALCLIGQSGTGKTTVLHKALARVKAFEGYQDPTSDSLLISIVAPSPGVSKQVAMQLLRALGYTTERVLQENVAWDLVRRQIALRGVRFVHIDELQHIHQVPNPIEIQKVRDTLKALMQNSVWPVSLILSGTPEIAPFLQADTQIRRRCTIVKFDSLSMPRDIAIVRTIVAQFCQRGGLDHDGLIRDLRSKEDKATDEFVRRLAHASIDEIGIVIEMVQDAITIAIRAGDDKLTGGHFASAYQRRTGCDAMRNVFLAFEWETIDVRSALYPENALKEEDRSRRRTVKNGGTY
ncbi:ATP-binding protein [Aureimonas phyllosphaerae]|uniref:ATP-binding protein n=1 Tax=Aureimonas phyllosphaerae TaxID=1166078 RepID=UPI003A5C0E87